MTEETRRKTIKKYKKQLNGIANSQTGETKAVVTMLIDRLSYLAALLDEL